jgi:hypothetical protein
MRTISNGKIMQRVNDDEALRFTLSSSRHNASSSAQCDAMPSLAASIQLKRQLPARQQM